MYKYICAFPLLSFCSQCWLLSERSVQIPVCWYPRATACQAASLERHTLLPLKIALQRWREMAIFTWCSLATQEIWSQNWCQDLPRRASRGKNREPGPIERKKRRGRLGEGTVTANSSLGDLSKGRTFRPLSGPWPAGLSGLGGS